MEIGEANTVARIWQGSPANQIRCGSRIIDPEDPGVTAFASSEVAEVLKERCYPIEANICLCFVARLYSNLTPEASQRRQTPVSSPNMAWKQLEPTVGLPLIWTGMTDLVDSRLT